MASSLDWIASSLQHLSEEGLLRGRRIVTSLAGGKCLVGGRELVNFAGNDYLDLAHDPRVIAAGERALRESAAGAGASALVSGRTPWHAALEARLARFENQPAAILFPTGYAANVGTICSLVGPGDVVFCDRFNHASLVEGCRTSGARLRVYRHDRLEALDRELRKASEFRRRLIVTDGLFSMDGDLAPLPALCDLADRHEAMLLVDEAHGTGVFGEAGRGVAELQQVEDRIAVRVGTLSKAVGSLGGFVAGSQNLIDWLWNNARTQIYSTALPPSACAAAAAAIDIIEAEPQRRAHLHELSTRLRESLAATGVATAPDSTGPIVPVVLGAPEAVQRAAGLLEEQGFLVGAIRPPTVPQGTSRLRISISSGHSARDVAELSERLAEIVNVRP